MMARLEQGRKQRSAGNLLISTDETVSQTQKTYKDPGVVGQNGTEVCPESSCLERREEHSAILKAHMILRCFPMGKC